MTRADELFRMPFNGRAISILLCLLTVGALGLFAAYWYPKSITRDGDEVFWRGFGFVPTENAVIGRVYTRACVTITVPEDGKCDIDLTGPVKNGGRDCLFVARYPNGKIRARGSCNIRNSSVGAPSVSDIIEGVFYHPNGSESSTVRDGSGVETYWTHEGTKIWEARLDNYKRCKLTTWHRNGQLRAEFEFRNGNRHGPVQFFDEGGNHISTIVFEDGLEKDRS